MTVSSNFIQSRILRSAAMLGWRVWARSQFWRNGPRILVNSIPKAGTHLLTSELDRFAGLQNSRLHLENANLIEIGSNNGTSPKINVVRLESQLASVRGGQFFSAHMPWASEFEDTLQYHKIRTIFVLRDPRDILASRYHYIMGLRRHPLHEFFSSNDFDLVARYRLLIEGHEADPFMRPVSQLLEQFAPWTQSSSTLTVRFEDLVGARGGGSDDRKREVLLQIADHCGIERSSVPDSVIGEPTKTATLRKGKSGGWRDELPQVIQDLVDERCNSQLRAMGYN